MVPKKVEGPTSARAEGEPLEQLAGRLTPSNTLDAEGQQAALAAPVTDLRFRRFYERSRDARTPAEGLAAILEAHAEAAEVWAELTHLRLSHELMTKPMSEAAISEWLGRQLDRILTSVLKLPAHVDVAERREAAMRNAFWGRLGQLVGSPTTVIGGSA